MDCMRIARLLESDFDQIIAAIGGHRFSPPTGRNPPKNADYIVDDAIVELKLIEEEGLEKADRQRKVANIFRANQPDRPVVILQPEILPERAKRQYYAAMARPIKARIEGANKQLRQTAKDIGGNPNRVLVLVNNGYASLNHHEFKDIAVRRACNDTSHIDALVIAGMYYHSDGFDSYLLEYCDLFPLDLRRPFRAFDAFKAELYRLTTTLLTELIRGGLDRNETRLPVQDLAYELEGVRYVKPAPQIGAPSKFYINGRPRHPSSAEPPNEPPVARSFPNLAAESWKLFAEANLWDRFSWREFLKPSFEEWIRFRNETSRELDTPTMPFVPMDVEFDDWATWCNDNDKQLSVRSLCSFANQLFQDRVVSIAQRATTKSLNGIVPLRYVLLTVEEIGQDQANDLCTISIIDETLDGSEHTPLVEDERMVWFRGVALASAHALKHGIDTVLYEKDLTHAWI